jgi:hypothetical protein
MLIDCSYFTKGARHILNASLGTLPNANSADVCSAIEAYIAEHQEQYLIEMLGPTLGNKFNAYLVCIDEDENPTRNERMDVVCDLLKESFADYVFFHILRDANTQVTMTGIVLLKSANTYVAPIKRQVSVWNTMVDRNRRFSEWCQSAECTISGISISNDMTTKINSLNL